MEQPNQEYLPVVYVGAVSLNEIQPLFQKSINLKREFSDKHAKLVLEIDSLQQDYNKTPWYTKAWTNLNKAWFHGWGKPNPKSADLLELEVLDCEEAIQMLDSILYRINALQCISGSSVFLTEAELFLLDQGLNIFND